MSDPPPSKIQHHKLPCYCQICGGRERDYRTVKRHSSYVSLSDLSIIIHDW